MTEPIEASPMPELAQNIIAECEEWVCLGLAPYCIRATGTLVDGDKKTLICVLKDYIAMHETPPQQSSTL